MSGDEPARRLSWKSLPGADIDWSGTVHFAETLDGTGTELRVRLHYDIPCGAAGRLAGWLVGRAPEPELTDEQVLHLSDILPTGHLGADMCGIARGDVVAVWGAGPVGLFSVVSAHLLGASQVIAIDRVPERLVLAES